MKTRPRREKPASHQNIWHQSRLMKIFLVLALMACGAAQTLSLAPFNIWLLGPVSICIILLVTRALNAPSSSFKGFLYGWLFGLGLFGSGASWVYVSIHTYGYASPLLAGSLTLVFVLGLALFPGLSFFVYGKLKSASKVGNAFLFCACWVMGDLFRTFFLTGFPWLFLGYGHLNTPLSGWIPLIGVYGLSAITVLSGIALYFLASLAFKALPVVMNTNPQRGKQRLLAVYPLKKTLFKTGFIALVLLLWLIGPLLNQIQWTQDADKTLRVALMQTNIPQEEKWKPEQGIKTLQLLEDMTTQAWGNWDSKDSETSNLIIWPETAVPMLYDQAMPFLESMAEQASRHNSTIISGLPFRHINPDGSQILHNSIASFGEGRGVYHKQKLVPFGEYVPLQELLRGLIAFFDLPMSDFRTGADNQPPLQAFTYKFASFICYEVVYPDFAAQLAKDTDFLLTISNDSWFGTSIGPLQHLEMAQLRAAETQRYMIRGTNNGITAVIDHRGRIMDQSEQFIQTTLHSQIKIFQGDTPFMRFGTWPVALISVLLIIYALLGHLRHARHSRKTR